MNLAARHPRHDCGRRDRARLRRRRRFACPRTPPRPVARPAHGAALGDVRQPPRSRATSPTVVVAIDEESYRAAPFKGAPTMTWTGEIGRVLNAIVEGGAKVVGFDIVYPQLDRAVGNPVRRRHARREGARLRPRFPARAGDVGDLRQGGARRTAARQRSDPPVARPAHRRPPAAEHPPAQQPTPTATTSSAACR